MPRDNGYRKDSSAPKYLPNLPAHDEMRPSPTLERRGDFTAVPNEWIRNDHPVIKLLSVEERMLYLCLLQFCWRKDYCFPSHRTLGTMVKRDRRTVIRYIKRLEEVGAIRVEHRNLGETNIYWIHDSSEMHEPTKIL